MIVPGSLHVVEGWQVGTLDKQVYPSVSEYDRVIHNNWFTDVIVN